MIRRPPRTKRMTHSFPTRRSSDLETISKRKPMIKLEFQKKLSFPSGEMNMDIALHMKEAEWVGIYGPSGAGKTTLLRFMAGLLRPHTGFLRINGETWCDTRDRKYVVSGKEV